MSKFNHIIDYVMKYGGRCRDCADEDGICPHDAAPCDPQVMRSAIKRTLEALEYGVANGFIETPFPRPTPARCDELETVAYKVYGHNKQPKLREIGLTDYEKDWGFSAVELVTRQNAEAIIAKKEYLLSVQEIVSQQLQGNIVTLTLKVEDLEADNKRLREALAEIRYTQTNSPSDAMFDMPRADYLEMIIDGIKKTARAALGEVKS